MLPCLNSAGALRGLIRPRWISLAAVQCILLWSIPKTGVDLPQSCPAVITPSQKTGQTLMKTAAESSVQEKSYGIDEIQGYPRTDRRAVDLMTSAF